MSYVITHGPFGSETSISCETAAEALSIVEDLSRGGAVGFMVVNYQTEHEAIPGLRLLACAEKSQRLRSPDS